MIITITREFGSGGREIGKKVADRLGIKFYDKELLQEAAKESGFNKKFFERNDEHKGFLKVLFSSFAPIFGNSDPYANQLSDESLFKFQSDAIRKAANEGSCVFVGRTADYVLRDYKNTINIFITANMDQRIQRVCKRFDLDRAAARKFIKGHEDERASYYNYYTGKRWGHAESYDLCINSSLLGIEETERFIARFVRCRFGINDHTK